MAWYCNFTCLAIPNMILIVSPEQPPKNKNNKNNNMYSRHIEIQLQVSSVQLVATSCRGAKTQPNQLMARR